MALCQRVSQLILFILPPHFEKLRKKIKKMLILDFSFSSQKNTGKQNPDCWETLSSTTIIYFGGHP